MREKLAVLMRDRLVWFIAFGLVLFALDWAASRRDARVIRIDLPLVEKLVAQWEGQTKRRPNAQELDSLIEGYIREEILVREAQAMGLDDNDVIVRRRLAQKVEFFLSENAPPELPDNATLKAWFEDNRAAYDAPQKLSWRHVFAAEEAEAKSLLASLQNNPKDWRNMGQPFMLSRAYARQAAPQMSQAMGTRFVEAVFAQGDKKGWFGPVRSAYGWHAVEITENHAPQAAQFAPIAEKVATDWQNEQARLARQQAWAELRAGYNVELVPVEEQ